MDIDENAPGNISQQAVTRTTDNETGHEPSRSAPEVPLPPDDEAPIEEDMSDVDAANSVASEHPDSGSKSDATHPSGEPGDGTKEPRNMPASDPESGA